MSHQVRRPLLIIEFLLAVQVLFTLWSEVGGQYHLDLMFWPWKLGLSLLAASLIVAITACVTRQPGAESGTLPRQVWLYCALLIATVTLAGVVTYYYHLNEPSDEEQAAPQNYQTRHYQTRHEFCPRTMGCPALQPNAV